MLSIVIGIDASAVVRSISLLFKLLAEFHEFSGRAGNEAQHDTTACKLKTIVAQHQGPSKRIPHPMSPMIMEEDNLVEYINRSLDEEEEFHFLRFEFLQRLNIVNLQLDLVRLKGRFQGDKQTSIQDLEALDSTLQKYGERSFITESE